MAGIGRTILLANALRATQTARGTVSHICRAGYAKKAAAAAAKAGPAKQKKVKYSDTETDPEKLCTHLCGANLLIEGEDPKLGEDSDYPDWLWKLNIDYTKKNISEMDPETWEYWRTVRRMSLRRKNKLMKLRMR